MKRAIKTILIISLAVFGNLLIANLVQAGDNLVVEFEKTPLFNERDFKPGDKVIRWVKVTNKSGETKPIATEAINYPGFPNPGDVPDGDLSRALSIIIREKGASDLYGGKTGEKTLFNFYQSGETYLSDIASGNNKTYEFEIIFPSEKGNDWQGATTTFDILIGFQGKEGGSPPPPPPGGPSLPPGLTILEESATTTDVSAISATITWTTSYPASSEVIYDTESGKFNLSARPPKYGYAYWAGNDSERVIHHSVTITGLSASTTYYYRCVSHASLAISREYSFTTLGVKEEEKVEERRIPPEEELLPPEENIPAEEIVLAPPEEEIVSPEEVVVPPEKEVVTLPPAGKIPGEGLASLLLASLGMIRESTWLMVLAIFCIIGLIVIGVREWELARRKKKQI